MFNPNGVGIKNNNLFGFPRLKKDNQIIVIPSCLDLTASYLKGTSLAPSCVLEVSTQLDFYHPFTKSNLWERGVNLLPISAKQIKENNHYSKKADEIITKQELGKALSSENLKALNQINEFCLANIKTNYDKTKKILEQGNFPTLLGGDHSNAQGIIEAVAEYYGNIGVLQLDAHADLRKAYEGFTYSHASISYNILNNPAITSITQLGVRDVSPNEVSLIEKNSKVKTFFDWDVKQHLFEGNSWKSICQDIVASLPKVIYITYDIDVLTPFLCPNTGTPVPGGYSLEQINFLINLIKKEGVKIVGFDLCETGNAVWDANVGARIFWNLCNFIS